MPCFPLCSSLARSGLAESASVFVFNGQILGDSTSVESIIAAGGHIAAAQSGVELVFDPEHMVCAAHVVVCCCATCALRVPCCCRTLR